MASSNVQFDNNDLASTLQQDIPGPLIVSDSAKGVWNAAVETAQYHIQSHTTIASAHFQTTVEERCWVTLMALRREEELQELVRYLEGAWRELNEVKKLLGI